MHDIFGTNEIKEKKNYPKIDISVENSLILTSRRKFYFEDWEKNRLFQFR